MTKFLTVSISLAALVLGAATHNAQAAPSVCKGLEQPACSSNPTCKWQGERIAGQTKTLAGTISKTSAKAHCRKDVPSSEWRKAEAPKAELPAKK